MPSQQYIQSPADYCVHFYKHLSANIPQVYCKEIVGTGHQPAANQESLAQPKWSATRLFGNHSCLSPQGAKNKQDKSVVHSHKCTASANQVGSKLTVLYSYTIVFDQGKKRHGSIDFQFFPWKDGMSTRQLVIFRILIAFNCSVCLMYHKEKTDCKTDNCLIGEECFFKVESPHAANSHKIERPKQISDEN